MRVKDQECETPSIESALVVREFTGFFPNELLRVPLEREIDFGIEFLPYMNPISIPPYRMVPAELKEFNAQLKGLLDQGFNRPSTSP